MSRVWSALDLLNEGDVSLAQAHLRSGCRDVLHLGRDHLVVAELAARQWVGGLLAACGAVVGEGVGVGTGDSLDGAGRSGSDSRPLITAARPMPPATTTAAVAATSAMRERLMNEWA